MYTAIVTPYVASFHISEPGFSENQKRAKTYAEDPIAIVDFIGKLPSSHIRHTSCH